jgi:hypothetical protein
VRLGPRMQGVQETCITDEKFTCKSFRSSGVFELHFGRRLSNRLTISSCSFSLRSFGSPSLPFSSLWCSSPIEEVQKPLVSNLKSGAPSKTKFKSANAPKSVSTTSRIKLPRIKHRLTKSNASGTAASASGSPMARTASQMITSTSKLPEHVAVRFSRARG